MKTAKNMEPLQRVSYRQPCPICGKPDWCGFNSKIAICMRVQSSYPVRNGGWLHKLKDSPVNTNESVVITDKSVPAAPVETKDRVYRDFMSFLTLSSEHQKELSVNRRLPERIIKQYFRSTPKAERPWTICKRLIDRGHSLEGVPGFYRVKNRKGGYYWTFSMKSGYVFPLLDGKGRIQAIQTRLDVPDTRGKYRLFSSSKKKSGSSSGAPVHVAKPDQLIDQKIWITEGPLKATIASQYLNATVLGLIGATTWRPVLKILESYQVAEVIVAFDMDQKENVWVKRAVKELTQELKHGGNNVKIAAWNEPKGIDDALLANKEVFLKELSNERY
ncbi:MAG: DUF3854 domain-containing protein [Firmicutes bacterium]|nr:DUF3854 domain-containing protein [Bacillota bacterium]